MSETQGDATQGLDACKALVRHFLEEGVVAGNPGVIDELLDPTYAFPGGGGRDRAEEILAVYRRAVPDIDWVIEEQLAERDTVVTRFVAYGTHRGPILGLIPTGRSTAVSGVLISRCRKGRIVEHWFLVDLLGLLQQLGLMPELPLDQVVAVARMQHASTACMSRWGER